jgi:hypothetical protein
MADRFDLEAIEADDALLDLLAAGGESAWEAGEHDPALMLLAGLRVAVEVEDELPVETIDDPESFLARCAALNPVTDPFARKMAARSLALGVAAVAALSVSGVAAAVTGNPLSPYEKVIEKVVDGLRDETSFPKKQLDGMPVVDKTKIVKVAKDYQKAAEERQLGEKTKDEAETTAEPAAAVDMPKPPLARAMPQTEQQLLIETPIEPTTPVAPEKPAEPETEPETPVDPTAPTTTEPTQPPTSEPTQEPTTPPTSEPTQEPSTPTTPPPTTTEPTTPPSVPPSVPGGDNGSTGNPGENPGESPSAPATQPPSVPPSVPSTGDNGGEQGSPGDDQTSPGGDQTGDPQGDDKPGTDVPAPETGNQTGDQPGDQSDEKPADPVKEPADPVKEIVENVLPAVLPTPTGTPIAEPERLQQYFGKGITVGKHSNGKPVLGWAKLQYAKGKHASGKPAEGRHAAIARAHGSMAPVTIRQILGLLNTPMTDR